ncbi:hypothetical protein N6N95_17310, partial [Escherichia coli]|nr:hypothetical protein [Escherichia coli]MDC7060589.1 hypothetical protein [Escherichia coli]MDC7081842.1 hypothetical protein [Escherichia coli]
NQESRLPPGSDFRRWVWITIAPFVTSQAEFEEIAKEKLMKARENEINLLKSRLAKLISDHQALAKEYRQELAQIISFNDFLSVPREFSKAV